MPDLSIYLHIPFCRTRCTYCDFNIYTNLGNLRPAYADALARDIRTGLAATTAGVPYPALSAPFEPVIARADDPAPGLEWTVRSLYIGGGTPSMLTVAQLETIMAAVCDPATDSIHGGTVRIADNAEITLEANPGTLPPDKLEALRRMGVNRLSFGVQVFDDSALKQLGRTHNAAGAEQAYRQARRAGFDNISLDFIYALPGQTVASWRETLNRALALQPNHISMYALILEEQTALGRYVREGKVALPNEDAAAEMYEAALAMNRAAGYEQYEISNWAHGSARENGARHNLVYWLNRPYQGYGPGAFATWNGQRYGSIRDPRDYITRVNAGETTVDSATLEPQTRGLVLADTIILGLRLNAGLSLARIAARFGQPIEQLFPGVVERFVALDVLEYRRAGDCLVLPPGLNPADDPALPAPLHESPDDLRLCLTERGRLVSNEIFVKFLPD